MTIFEVNIGSKTVRLYQARTVSCIPALSRQVTSCDRILVYRISSHHHIHSSSHQHPPFAHRPTRSGRHHLINTHLATQAIKVGQASPPALRHTGQQGRASITLINSSTHQLITTRPSTHWPTRSGRPALHPTGQQGRASITTRPSPHRPTRSGRPALRHTSQQGRAGITTRPSPHRPTRSGRPALHPTGQQGRASGRPALHRTGQQGRAGITTSLINSSTHHHITTSTHQLISLQGKTVASPLFVLTHTRWL